MDYKKIKILLDNYFDGNTSLEDESKLQQYFLSDHIDQKLLEYRPIFQNYHEEKNIKLGEDFDRKLFEKIQDIEDQKTKSIFLIPRWMKVAATVALLIGITFIFKNQFVSDSSSKQIAWETYEPESPEEAYEAAKNALLLVSNKLNNGTNTATDNLSKMKAMNKIFK